MYINVYFYIYIYNYCHSSMTQSLSWIFGSRDTLITRVSIPFHRIARTIPPYRPIDSAEESDRWQQKKNIPAARVVRGVVVLIQLSIGTLDRTFRESDSGSRRRGVVNQSSATRGLAAQDNTYLPSIFVHPVLQSNYPHPFTASTSRRRNRYPVTGASRFLSPYNPSPPPSERHDTPCRRLWDLYSREIESDADRIWRDRRQRRPMCFHVPTRSFQRDIREERFL